MSDHAPDSDHVSRLKSLQLFGMATAWRELQAEAPRNKTLSLEALLLRLLDAEQADRQARSLRYQLKAARFPIHRDLTAFDWSETPLDGARIQQLAKGHYLETAHNLILVGGTGTGKTHLAIALGVAAIHHGKRIRFYNAVDQNVLPFLEPRKGKTPWSIYWSGKKRRGRFRSSCIHWSMKPVNPSSLGRLISAVRW
jgi:hypothetical protein